MQGTESRGEFYAQSGNQFLPVWRSAQAEAGLFQLFQQLRLLRGRDTHGIARMISDCLLPPVLQRSGTAEAACFHGMFSEH